MKADRIKNLAIMALAVVLSGCATYQSMNRISIKAEKASYPMGLRMIQVVNGEIIMERNMTTGRAVK